MKLNYSAKRLARLGRWMATALLFISAMFGWQGAFFSNSAIAAPVIATSGGDTAKEKTDEFAKDNKNFIDTAADKVKEAARSNASKVDSATDDDSAIAGKAKRDAARIQKRANEDASRTKEAVDNSKNAVKRAVDGIKDALGQ